MVACVSEFGELSSCGILCASYYIAKLRNRQHVTESICYVTTQMKIHKLKHLLILLGQKKILLCNVPGTAGQW
jgi:hypothetical protein